MTVCAASHLGLLHQQTVPRQSLRSLMRSTTQGNFLSFLTTV